MLFEVEEITSHSRGWPGKMELPPYVESSRLIALDVTKKYRLRVAASNMFEPDNTMQGGGVGPFTVISTSPVLPPAKPGRVEQTGGGFLETDGTLPGGVFIFRIWPPHLLRTGEAPVLSFHLHYNNGLGGPPDNLVIGHIHAPQPTPFG